MPERGGWFLGFIRVRGRLLLVLKDLDGEIELGGSARAVDVGRERDGEFEQAPLAAGEGRRRNKRAAEEFNGACGTGGRSRSVRWTLRMSRNKEFGPNGQ